MFGRKKPKENITRIDNPAIIGMINPQDGSFVVRLLVDQIRNSGIAGVMLADIAVHISKALAQAKMEPEDEALRTIVAIFNAERQNPTDIPVGGLIQ